MTDTGSLLVIMLIIAVSLRWTRLRRVSGPVIGVVGFTMLAIGASPVAKLLLLPLENRFPARSGDSIRPSGIIVLGGVLEARGQPQLFPSGSRHIAALTLAMAHPDATLVLSGGAEVDGLTEAEAAAQLSTRLGFSANRLVKEPHSKTTAENASFTARIVRPKPGECWVLVTSAYHMPRAIAAFRAQGLDLAAFPVDNRTSGDERDYAWFKTGVGPGLALVDLALHEWVGLIWYRLTGRSAEMFPVPAQTACTQ